MQESTHGQHLSFHQISFRFRQNSPLVINLFYQQIGCQNQFVRFLPNNTKCPRHVSRRIIIITQIFKIKLSFCRFISLRHDINCFPTHLTAVKILGRQTIIYPVYRSIEPGFRTIKLLRCLLIFGDDIQEIRTTRQ